MAANLNVAVLFIGCIPLTKSDDKIKTQAGFFAFDKFTLQNLANKSGGVSGLLFFLYTTSEIHSTMRRCFVFTDLGQILLFFEVFKHPQICWQEFVK